MEKKYTIDLERGTVTHVIDSDTKQSESASLNDLIGLLFYLRGREGDLRRLVYTNAPIQIRRAMTPQGGFWVGCTEDRRRVKVSAEKWQAKMIEVEKLTRSNWSYQKQDEAKQRRGPVALVQYDRNGNELPLPYELIESNFTPDDCPLDLVQKKVYEAPQPIDNEHSNCLITRAGREKAKIIRAAMSGYTQMQIFDDDDALELADGGVAPAGRSR